MAYTSNKNKKVNVQYFQDIADQYRKSKSTSSTVDIISFIEAQWGLGQRLFPVQKFILKTFYGLPLDNEQKSIVIPDEMNMHEIGRFTESGFMDYLIDTGRTNLSDYNAGHPRRELVLNCGRRASKCLASQSSIYTDHGILLCGEVLNMVSKGEKVGIFTLNENGILECRDDILVEDNGIHPCVSIYTESGYNETSTLNHPYWVIRKNGGNVSFVEASCIEEGDFVAVSRKNGSFGENDIGDITSLMLASLSVTANHSQNLIECLSSNLVNIDTISSMCQHICETNVPKPILTACKSNVMHYIAGLYLCDGWYASSETGGEIVLALRSRSMVMEVQRMLLLFGIRSTFCGKKKKWFIRVCDKNSAFRLAGLIDSSYGTMEKITRYFHSSEPSFTRKWIGNDMEWERVSFGMDTSLFQDEQQPEGYPSYNQDSVVWERVVYIEDAGLSDTIAMEVPVTHIIANEIISHNSSITAFIATYETYRLLRMGNPQGYFGFPKGQEIAVCTTASSETNAMTLFNLIKSYCLNCNFLKDKVVNRSREFFTLCTDSDAANGADPSIFLLCGGAKSTSIRGHNNIVVIIDEAAFLPVTGDGNGDELYSALTPSISTFTKRQDDGTLRGEGKIILLSSPYGKSGLFYKKFIESFDFRDSMLMFNMYTSMVNPSVDSSILHDEKKRNPSMFECEYCAKFSDAVSAWVEESAISEVIDEKLPVNSRKGTPGIEYYMGIDYGGKTDGAAIAIVHKDDNKIVLDYADVYYGSQSDVWNDELNGIYRNANRMFAGEEYVPLDGFSSEIKRLNEIYPSVYGWFDQFNGYGLFEALDKKGLHQFEIKSLTSSLNQQMYQMAKELIYSKLVRIPNHPVLVPEMTTLQEIKTGAKTSVSAPQRRGFHDDITDAFVIACYGCYLNQKNVKSGGRAIGIQNENGISIISSKRAYDTYHLKKMRDHGSMPYK